MEYKIVQSVLNDTVSTEAEERHDIRSVVGQCVEQSHESGVIFNQTSNTGQIMENSEEYNTNSRLNTDNIFGPPMVAKYTTIHPIHLNEIYR